MSVKMTREDALAAQWEMSLEQIRLLRRRHKWPHVAFSRQDIRYTEDQIRQIIVSLSTTESGRRGGLANAGLTDRAARRAS